MPAFLVVAFHYIHKKIFCFERFSKSPAKTTKYSKILIHHHHLFCQILKLQRGLAINWERLTKKNTEEMDFENSKQCGDKQGGNVSKGHYNQCLMFKHFDIQYTCALHKIKLYVIIIIIIFSLFLVKITNINTCSNEKLSEKMSNSFSDNFTKYKKNCIFACTVYILHTWDTCHLYSHVEFCQIFTYKSSWSKSTYVFKCSHSKFW